MAKTIKSTEEEVNKVCGIVMPISAIDGCLESHWKDVQDVLKDVIRDAGFEPNLVSDADDIGVIHKRIIQNLYDNPIVVCDVSGKNPNVMFELGIRLAFDKPTIIVKDDKTNYSFDTSVIEHLTYPRDLRFNQIVDFKTSLKEKITKTYERAVNDDNYTPFLGNFGKFKVAKIETEVVSPQELIQETVMEDLRTIKELLYSNVAKENLLRQHVYWMSKPEPDADSGQAYEFCCGVGVTHDKVQQGIKLVYGTGIFVRASTIAKGHNHYHVSLRSEKDNFLSAEAIEYVQNTFKSLGGKTTKRCIAPDTL